MEKFKSIDDAKTLRKISVDTIFALDKVYELFKVAGIEEELLKHISRAVAVCQIIALDTFLYVSSQLNKEQIDIIKFFDEYEKK